MRKVHYRVVLDVLAVEDDDADGLSAMHDCYFSIQQTIESADNFVEIQDVIVESIEVTDSR